MTEHVETSLLGGFAPVIDDATKILILGSFPGVASLAAGQYYAHPRNQFWPLMAALIGVDLLAMPYAGRLARLQACQIGLWDVIGGCERSGSLDSAIRHAEENDFGSLRQRCPALQLVGFNGKTSGKFAARFTQAGLDTLVLPSSSPAYASLSFNEKLGRWRKLMD